MLLRLVALRHAQRKPCHQYHVHDADDHARGGVVRVGRSRRVPARQVPDRQYQIQHKDERRGTQQLRALVELRGRDGPALGDEHGQKQERHAAQNLEDVAQRVQKWHAHTITGEYCPVDHGACHKQEPADHGEGEQLHNRVERASAPQPTGRPCLRQRAEAPEEKHNDVQSEEAALVNALLRAVGLKESQRVVCLNLELASDEPGIPKTRDQLLDDTVMLRDGHGAAAGRRVHHLDLLRSGLHALAVAVVIVVHCGPARFLVVE
mmetsp:Transcript_13476/g.32071  ORF Transcript_13476/g.32071 Transcript_13476/m.32071 type:complete len:264 (+) Transcript_13476:328-1119(+)